MCGIAGIFSAHHVDKLDERIRKMCNAMSHRGPDAAGTIILSPNVAIGHRRLSIIDLSELANQPMTDHYGRYYLSYNGEIVNFAEIKKELNYKFRTNSDTEVILGAVIEKGIDWFLSKAIGMFGFLLYDATKHVLIVARDHFGIKPVFYSISNGVLIIASEIRGILSSGLVEARLQKNAIDEYLGYRYIKEPNTFFEGIYQVPHGSYIMFDNDLNCSVKQYYKIPALNTSNRFDEKELVSELKVRIEEAVKRWCIADVKVGSYLSGGLDSSLLTAIISSGFVNLDTYTIGFSGDNLNEFSYAREVAECYKTNHREFLIDYNDYILEWDHLIQIKGAPLGVPNEIPLAIMTTRLSPDITVVLSGEGADELFGGYGQIFRSPYDYNNGHLGNDFYAAFINKYEYVSRSFRNKYLADKEEQLPRENTEIHNMFAQHSNEESVFLFFHHYHIQGLLQRLDACTMQASIEARPPFLDRELVDFVYKEIPYNLKLSWNSQNAKLKARQMEAKEYSETLDTPKYILKRVAESYLPNELIYRRKMGFPVPFMKDVSYFHDMAEKLLTRSEWLYHRDFESIISDLQHEKRPGQVLWMLINIEKFINIYLCKEWRY